MLLEKETIFSEDVETILGKSAQQVEKELLEPKAEGETIATNEGEITYIIEPAKSDEEITKTE